MIYSDFTELIGHTPLIRLSRLCKANGLPPIIFGKLEKANPSGSAKDRAAFYMIRDAEIRHLLIPGGLIIEPTSGNTGIGIAACAAVMGYKACIIMPDSMSEERKKLISAFGAEIILTPGSEGMAGAVKKAEEIHKKNPGSIIAGQFINPANSEAHYNTTGPEIWKDMEGSVDIFVASVGTGGTITGTGRFLKEKKQSIKVIAVEPAASPLLSCGKSGPHNIQGIGANFVPDVLDTSIYDEIIQITDEDAFDAMKDLAKIEALLCGISSGATIAAALTLALRPENSGKNIVALLPDTGERYLSVI